jgi:hypothetical protein
MRPSAFIEKAIAANANAMPNMTPIALSINVGSKIVISVTFQSDKQALKAKK